jgi:hypothetical protein
MMSLLYDKIHGCTAALPNSKRKQKTKLILEEG